MVVVFMLLLLMMMTMMKIIMKNTMVVIMIMPMTTCFLQLSMSPHDQIAATINPKWLTHFLLSNLDE